MVLVLVHRFPNKQNHPRAIHPNETNRPHAIYPNETNHPRIIHPNETVGAVPTCPPERSRSGVSIPKIHASCARINDGCAPAGRRGRAHRHRPYPSPSYFSTHPTQTKSTAYAQSPKQHQLSAHVICPNETVGAVAMCPPERPRSSVSMPKIHALYAGMNDGCALAGRHGRAHRHRPYQPPS